jgi:predicted transposase YbfD/YdcC
LLKRRESADPSSIARILDCSKPGLSTPTAAEFAASLRGHWQIENGLHRVRDVTFAEDRSQVRTERARSSTASLRNLIISILR